jgi:hypothetical protein
MNYPQKKMPEKNNPKKSAGNTQGIKSHAIKIYFKYAGTITN